MIFIICYLFFLLDRLSNLWTRGGWLEEYAAFYKVEANYVTLCSVQGRECAMIGFPAQKLLPISASKYFGLLFDQEHLFFPHLSEDWLFPVLDIGMSVRLPIMWVWTTPWQLLLQVDCAMEELEVKRTALEDKARALSSPKPRKTVHCIMKRRAKSKDKKQQSDIYGKVSATAKHLGTTEPSILVGTLFLSSFCWFIKSQYYSTQDLFQVDARSWSNELAYERGILLIFFKKQSQWLITFHNSMLLHILQT